MVQPTLQTAELIQSVGRLVNLLPSYRGSPTDLTEALIHAAGDNCRADCMVETHHGMLDLRARIIEYADDVVRHAGAGQIPNGETLIADFVRFLIRPLRIAERDVMRLEGCILTELSQHEAMGVANIDFRAPEARRRSENLFEQFIERVSAYREEINALTRRVVELERIFRDPEEIILRTRSALRDIGDMIAQLDDAAQTILKLGDNDILRAKCLKNIHATFDGRADPFGCSGSLGKDDGVAPCAGADSMFAGAFGLIQEAQVIPLRFALKPAMPAGRE